MNLVDDILIGLRLDQLPEQVKLGYSQHLSEELIGAVIDRLSRELDDELLGELQEYLERPLSVLLTWLEISVAGFRRVMREERDALMQRLAPQVDELLALERSFTEPAARNGAASPSLDPQSNEGDCS